MFPTRRTFLQTTVAIASLFLPKLLNEKRTSSWFIHADTGDSWHVADPVQWALGNARQPILERASKGLLTLTSSDGDRIVRLVVRRCRLNLIELRPAHVVVQHWGSQGLADLRPFFKAHGLARKEIKVVVRERKKEITTTKTGDDFLFGERVTADFQLDLYLSKWHRRFNQQSDDWSAAPETWSGYAWDGIESNRIPWAALKSAWRRITPLICSNCDQPTVLANFGYPSVGMFNRSPRFIHVCRNCRRSFRDDSIKDVGNWMAINLDAKVQPDSIMMWGSRVKRRST